MDDLIAALQIFRKYGNPPYPTHCEHDVMLVTINPADVSEEDIAKLDELGFFPSDDGETFFGAYGPKIVAQLDYVVAKLLEDQDTRQAGLTIWRENPPATKDVPCTVAAFFNIRNGQLNAHVFMRSSDVWLGVPYDVFNFSMLAHLVCAHLNKRGLRVAPGHLFLTAASSHLYAINWDDAKLCVMGDVLEQHETPHILFEDPGEMMDWLRDLRETRPGDDLRWWEV